VTQLKSAIPYVDSVSNLVPAAGGADGEEPSSVRQRGPAVLRHRHRAVAIVDFEDLALEASPAVARAKGVPARDAAGAGHVEVVVVPRSSERRPVPSLELLRLIEDRVGALAPPTVDLVVRGPEWLAVSVTAEIAPQSFERAAAVRNAVLARLEGFLHPLTGGLDGQGWAFGRSPHRSDLHALIEAIPGVDYVNALTVATMPERPIISERLLVHSGDHQVILVAARRADS
jgi:predicted phage baseplate assembly protein